jgi:hypothetical protein
MKTKARRPKIKRIEQDEETFSPLRDIFIIKSEGVATISLKAPAHEWDARATCMKQNRYRDF